MFPRALSYAIGRTTMKGDGGRSKIYVSVEDALKNDAFPDFLEVQKRSLQVTTKRSLVTVYADETERAREQRGVCM